MKELLKLGWKKDGIMWYSIQMVFQMLLYATSNYKIMMSQLRNIQNLLCTMND